MSSNPIDVDAEAIFLDGTWQKREDLARRIKAMLDSGDYAVAKLSTALEQLTQAMANVRTVSFRMSAELADALAAAAQRQGKTQGALLRDLAAQAVGAPAAPAAAPSTAPATAEDKPVELTKPKKREDETAEQRWFKG